MNQNRLKVRDYFLQPGYVCVPAAPTRLSAVVASGISVVLYDPKHKRGGMNHFLRPVRSGGQSTVLFAAPAIVALKQLMHSCGSTFDQMEAYLYGGAENPEAPGFEPGLAEKNIDTGIELLTKLGIPIAGKDVGGTRARKVVFHTETGETVIARVDRVRSGDWYPDWTDYSAQQETR